MRTRELWIPTLLMAAALPLLGAPASASAAKDPQVVAYVDLQRAILEVDEGKRAKDNLQKAFEAKKAKIKAEEAKLVKMRDEIRQQAAVKTDDEVKKRAAEFEQRVLELQQALQKEQKELQELEQKELAEITKKMTKIIQGIGGAGGYSLILEAQSARLLFAEQQYDLTNEVIRKYNQTHK